MKVLLAGLGSPGFVVPLIACAQEVRRRGHEVAFVTGISLGAAVARAGFSRIPKCDEDGPSFTVPNWFHVDAILTQIEHLEYAVQQFRPDAVVTSFNCLGPLVVAPLHRLHLVVVGSLVVLTPTAAEMAVPAVTPQDVRRRWRLESLLARLNELRDHLGMDRIAPDDASALFGDRHVVQGIAALQPERDLEAFSFAGGGLFRRESSALGPDEAEWILGQRGLGRRIVYAQLGRTFDQNSYTDALFAWARARDVALIVDGARHDRHLDNEADRVLRRDGIDHNDLLPHVDGVVCGGHPAAVIGALNYRRPLAICHGGSGTDDIGEACARIGVAAVVDTARSEDGEFVAAFDRLTDDPQLDVACSAVADAFERLDSRAVVADVLSELAEAYT